MPRDVKKPSLQRWTWKMWKWLCHCKETNCIEGIPGFPLKRWFLGEKVLYMFFAGWAWSSNTSHSFGAVLSMRMLLNGFSTTQIMCLKWNAWVSRYDSYDEHPRLIRRLNLDISLTLQNFLQVRPRYSVKSQRPLFFKWLGLLPFFVG